MVGWASKGSRALEWNGNMMWTGLQRMEVPLEDQQTHANKCKKTRLWNSHSQSLMKFMLALYTSVSSSDCLGPLESYMNIWSFGAFSRLDSSLIPGRVRRFEYVVENFKTESETICLNLLWRTMTACVCVHQPSSINLQPRHQTKNMAWS